MASFSFVKKLFGNPEEPRMTETFREELNHQCRQIMGFVSLISVAWLPYIPTDQALHPDKPILILLRLGLPLLGLTIFLLRRFPRFKDHGLLYLILFGGYLEIATGIITGITGGHSVYIGGYLFILTLLAAAPLPRRTSWTILLLSLTAFFLTGRLNGMTFHTREELYSLNDILSTSLVAAVLIYLLNAIRYRSWRKSRIIADQKKELEKDKTKIDQLLQNILPVSVADELKENGSVKPIYYPSATIVFTDFVGFTRIAENLSPEKLVSELDSAFSHFDEIMDRYGLEKLKTIGDSYMFAGGIPESSTVHELDCLLASLEILNWIDTMQDQTDPRQQKISWQIRIGVNTGPLMAGVVGEKKFVYDIWGDSVNTASRLESGGVPGHINISAATKKAAEEFFEILPRGRITCKNKGEVDMFFASRLKPAFSQDPAGRTPNDAFWTRYRQLRQAPPKDRP